MKIVVSGGWSYGNIGDEAIASATIFLMNKYFEFDEIIYTSYDVDDFYFCHGIKAVPSLHRLLMQNNNKKLKIDEILNKPHDYGLLNYIELFEEKSVFIMSGGGFFVGPMSEKSFLARLLEVEIAKRMGAKIIIIGQSIGPAYSKEAENWLKRVLHYCDYLCVRDKSTIDFLKKIKVNNQIHYAPDLAIIISDVFEKKTRQNVVNIMPANYSIYTSVDLEKKPPRIFETLIRKFSIGSIIYRKEMRKLVKKLSLKYHLRFVMSTRWSWDQEYMKSLCKILDKNRYDVINCNTSEELCNSLSSGELLISVKMHPIIISCSYGVPTIGITYNFKLDNFMSMIGQSAKCFKNNKINANEIYDVVVDNFGKSTKKDKYSKYKDMVYNTMIEVMVLVKEN